MVPRPLPLLLGLLCGRCTAREEGWYLANYPNHVLGEPADYTGTEYGDNCVGGISYEGNTCGVTVSCKDTCEGLGFEKATGARYVCNPYGDHWSTWGCRAPTSSDGPLEEPSNAAPLSPGGENAHCMVMVFDVDYDGEVRLPPRAVAPPPGVWSDACVRGRAGRPRHVQ